MGLCLCVHTEASCGWLRLRLEQEWWCTALHKLSQLFCIPHVQPGSQVRLMTVVDPVDQEQPSYAHTEQQRSAQHQKLTFREPIIITIKHRELASTKLNHALK